MTSAKLNEIAQAARESWHATRFRRAHEPNSDVRAMWVEVAKTMLSVLREPDEGMLNAGAVIVPADLARQTFQAMIGHILEEKSE